MCLSNLRDKNSGVLTAVGENVHAVDVSGPGRAEERRQELERRAAERAARPTRQQKTIVDKVIDNTINTAARTIGTQIVRGIFGTLFKGK